METVDAMGGCCADAFTDNAYGDALLCFASSRSMATSFWISTSDLHSADKFVRTTSPPTKSIPIGNM